VQTLQEIIISLSNNLIHSCILKNLNEIFFYIITIKTTTEKIVIYCEYRASTTMPICNDEAPKIKLILILWQIKNPFILLFKSKIKLLLILWKIKNPFILLFKSKIKLLLILWKIKNPFILLFKSKIKLILILWQIKNPFILLF
jgi:hypothetical protein